MFICVIRSKHAHSTRIHRSLSQCHTASLNPGSEPPPGCAGIVLERPISGALNVSGVASPPGSARQPSSGCIPYGCQIAACGCAPGTPRGCTGVDFQKGVALIQRGEGIGEARPVSPAVCNFDTKLRCALVRPRSNQTLVKNLRWAASPTPLLHICEKGCADCLHTDQRCAPGEKVNLQGA